MRKAPPGLRSLWVRGFLLVLGFGAGMAGTSGVAFADGPWLPENISTIGESIDHLYNVIFGLVVVMFFLTEGVLLFFIFRYRRRPDRKAYYYPHNGMVETVWTVIPGLILLFLAIYQWNAWANARVRAPDAEDAVRVEVLAQQFEWKVRYPGPDGLFDTGDDLTMTNQIHIPEGTPILIQARALDVIHSFFLPHLRVKQDIVPGGTVLLWFDANKTGTYEIACAELCGLGHYRMRGQLFVYSQEEYDAWLQGKYDANATPADWGWSWEEGV